MQSSIFQNFKKYALSGLHRILSGQYNTTVHILGESGASLSKESPKKENSFIFKNSWKHLCVRTSPGRHVTYDAKPGETRTN